MQALVEQALAMRPGTKHIVGERFGQEVALAETIGGFGIVLTYLYADVNQIVVGYVLQGPAHRRFVSGGFSWLTVTALHGGKLRDVDGGSSAPMDHEQGWYMAFDAASLAIQEAQTAAYAVRVMAPSLTMFEDLDGTEPTAIPGETYEPAPRQTRAVTVHGPIAFDVTIPVTLRVREAFPAHTLLIDTTPVTLERVVVTPTEARLYLRGLNLVGDHIPVLAVDGHQIAGNHHPQPAGVTVSSFLAPLDDYHGGWAVVILAHPESGPGGRRYTTPLLQLSPS
jgi:hypothetical protein